AEGFEVQSSTIGKPLRFTEEPPFDRYFLRERKVTQMANREVWVEYSLQRNMSNDEDKEKTKGEQASRTTIESPRQEHENSEPAYPPEREGKPVPRCTDLATETRAKKQKQLPVTQTRREGRGKQRRGGRRVRHS